MKPSDPPKLGDRCWCHKNSNPLEAPRHHHPLATDCLEECIFGCNAPRLPITVDEHRRALTHHRDHRLIAPRY